MQELSLQTGLGNRKSRGQVIKTPLCFRRQIHPACPFSPDMQTTEGSKQDPHNEGQGDGQKHRQELVDHIFADFKEGMAADPHFVKGVCSLRFCNQIIEA